jgi:chemotaxis protein CheC
MDQLSPFALDALGEVSNIGAGNAAGSLSQLLGASVDLDVPAASLVPLPDATATVGDAEAEVFAVYTGIQGAVGGCVLLVFSEASAATLCSLLGVDSRDEMGLSALQEIGNILTSSYVTAIGQLSGFALEPRPPVVAHNMLGALVDGVLAMAALDADSVLLVRTAMHIEGVQAEFGFLFVPEHGAVGALLGALGVPL